MRIRFQRTGGFAGIKLRTEVDSEQLPANQAQELKRLVEKARPFDQPERSSIPNQPDQFQYELMIEDDDRTQRIQASDTTASDDLRKLIDWLTDAARKGKGTNP